MTRQQQKAMFTKMNRPAGRSGQASRKAIMEKDGFEVTTFGKKDPVIMLQKKPGTKLVLLRPKEGFKTGQKTPLGVVPPLKFGLVSDLDEFVFKIPAKNIKEPAYKFKSGRGGLYFKKHFEKKVLK